MKKFVYFLLVSSFVFNSSTYAEEKTSKDQLVEEKTEEQINAEQKAKELYLNTINDFNSFYYFPSLNLGNDSNLVYGGNTLKLNEFFLRLNTKISLLPQDITSKTTSSSYLSPSISSGFGITDFLNLYLTLPTKVILGQNSGLINPSVALKYRFWDTKYTDISLQVGAVAPKLGTQFDTLSETYGSASTMLLGTTFFDPFYIQSGLGYKYTFPTSTTSKLNHQIPYFLDFGYVVPELEGALIPNITLYGNVSVLPNSQNEYLSIRPSITWKTNWFTQFPFLYNFDFSLSYDKTLLGSNIEDSHRIMFSLTSKYPSFKYHPIFTLMLLKKIDPEDLDKREDLKSLDLEKKVFISSCSKCHPLVSPSEYKSNQWEPIIRRYRDKKNINKAEEKAIVEFLKSYNSIEDSKISNEKKEP